MKKCKVVIVPVKDSDYKNHMKYPITNHKGNIRSPDYWGFLPPNVHFAHIELRDENDNLVATTQKDYGYIDCDKSGNDIIISYPSILQSFIDEFIASNGSIKEVMVETIKKCPRPSGCSNSVFCWDDDYDCNNCEHSKDWPEIPKLTSSGEVITHPVKTKIKISDVPIDAIKKLATSVGPSCMGNIGEAMQQAINESPWGIVNKWLKDNNL